MLGDSSASSRSITGFSLWCSCSQATATPLLGFGPTPDLSTLAWLWTHLSNLRIALHGWPSLPWPTRPFWSLAIEAHFYLVWPIVVYLLGRRALLAVCLGMMAAAPLFRMWLWHLGQGDANFVLTPTRMDALAAGALVAVLERGPGGIARLTDPARHLVTVIGVLLVPMLVLWQRGGFWVQVFGYGLVALFFGACFIVLLTPGQWPRVQALLTFPPFLAFGKYSYSIYLFHCAVIAALIHWGLDPKRMPTVLGSLLPAHVLLYAVTVGVSFVIGWVCWHGYEKRFLDLKRLFPYHLEPRPLAIGPLVAQAARAAEQGPQS